MTDGKNIDDKKLIGLLKKTGVIMEGHFLLTSGRHSGLFLQCSQLLQYPEYTGQVCSMMAEPFKNENIETVIGPAMGGVILSYEVARFLGARALFAEPADGKMILRRGFQINKGEKVLVVEDAVSTGGSVQKVLDLLSNLGADIAGISIMIDRTSGRLDLGVPTRALLSMDIASFDPDSCPLCSKGIALQKPKG